MAQMSRHGESDSHYPNGLRRIGTHSEVGTHYAYLHYLRMWRICRDCNEGSNTIKLMSSAYLPVPLSMQLADGSTREVNVQDAVPGENHFGAGVSISDSGAINPETTGDSKIISAYSNYKKRAEFPDLFRDAIGRFTGMINRAKKESNIPKHLDYNLFEGERSLDDLAQKITSELLIVGRVGVMIDFSVDNKDTSKRKKKVKPVAKLYEAERIVNWDYDDKGNPRFVVLDESDYRLTVGGEGSPYSRNDFISHQELNNKPDKEKKTSVAGILNSRYQYYRQYRVLYLDDNDELNVLVTNSFSNIEGDNDLTKKFRGAKKDNEETKGGDFRYEHHKPTINGEPIKFIPFIVSNAFNIDWALERPPLIKIAEDDISIYQLSADERLLLFILSQVFLTSVKDPDTYQGLPDGSSDKDGFLIGAGLYSELPPGVELAYVQPDPGGAAVLREKIQMKFEKVEAFSQSFISGSGYETGEAVRTRVGGQTASLVLLASNVSNMISHILTTCDYFIKPNKYANQMFPFIVPEDINLNPPTKFMEARLQSGEITALVEAKRAGAPLSMLTIHKMLRESGMTDMGFVDEIQQIIKEGKDKNIITFISQLAKLNEKLEPKTAEAPASQASSSITHKKEKQ